MALRVTAQYIDVAASGAAAKGIRVEAQHVEVAGTLDLEPKLRVEAQHVEVGGTQPSNLDSNLRVEAQMVEVAGDNPGHTEIPSKVRVTGWFLEVVRANDHRNITGVLGTLGSGLATETLQPGAGSQGPSFFEPENTGQVGSRSSLAGGHLVPGKALDDTALEDTGELATRNSVLNRHMILAFGANTLAPGEKFADGNNTISATDTANVQVAITVPATTDIDIDGTWTQTATSSIKSKFATSTLTMGVTSDHNFKFGNATTTISTLSQSASPGLFVLQANNTITLTGADSDSGIDEGDASSIISLTQSADKITPVLSVEAETTIPAMTVTAENNILEASAENTIALSDDIGVAGPLDADADSTINATVTADGVISAYGRFAENTIEFFGTNPNEAPAFPVANETTAESSIRNLYAATPDQTAGGTAPEKDTTFFTELWTQEPYLAQEYPVSAESILELTDFTPQPTGKRSVFAETTISLLDFVDNNVKTRAVNTPIALTQTADAERAYRAVTVINFTQTAEEGFVTLFAENTIVLDHIGRPNPRLRDGENTIVLTQEAKSSIKELSVSDVIPIAQDINVQRPWRVDAENEISGITDDIFVPPSGPIIPGVPFGLSDEATVGHDPVRAPTSLITIADLAQVVHIRVDATDLLADTAIGLTDRANLSKSEEALTVIDTLQVAATVNKNTTDALTLIDELASEATFRIDYENLPAESVIGIKHAVGYSLVRDTTDCDYTPFVSESDAETIPPRPILPEVRQPAFEGVRFRLAYPPFDTGATIDSVDLRAPEFGNREGINATRINRESQGGSLIVYADPVWPELHTLQMTFTALKQTQARELLTFIERWLGQEIGVYDHEGRVWKGIITNPDDAVTHDGRERFTAQIEFEAERVHQLNRVAQTNLGFQSIAGQDEALAFSTIGVTDQADYDYIPVAPAISALDVSDSSGYTKVPVGAGSSAIGMSGFATRNSFFYESASSNIILSDLAAELDFDDFGNLIHNYDAENTSGLNDGDPVVTLGDLGSSPVNLNSTAGQRPVVRDSVLGGRRVIEFRHSVAAQRMISVSNVPLWHLTNKTGTIFIVTILRETLSGGNETIMGNNTDKIFFGGSTSTQRPVALLSGEGTVALETPQSVITSGTTQLLVLKRSGNNLTFRRNKTAEDGTTFSTNPAPGNEQLYFGGFSGAGNSVDQDIAQVLIYDDALSNEDILTVEGLLSAKWGV